MRQALGVAGIVGPLLVLLNNADFLLVGEVPAYFLPKVVLTLAVPFFVSLYSSLRTLHSTSA